MKLQWTRRTQKTKYRWLARPASDDDCVRITLGLLVKNRTVRSFEPDFGVLLGLQQRQPLTPSESTSHDMCLLIGSRCSLKSCESRVGEFESFLHQEDVGRFDISMPSGNISQMLAMRNVLHTRSIPAVCLLFWSRSCGPSRWHAQLQTNSSKT